MPFWKTSSERTTTEMAMTSSGTAKVTLPTDRQILITREFDAPKHLVFQAWTTPDLVRRWWTTDRGEMTVCEIDLKVGGTWRYVMVTPTGFEVGFHGEFREILPDEPSYRADRPHALDVPMWTARLRTGGWFGPVRANVV